MVWFITLRTSFFLVLLIAMIYCYPGLGYLGQEHPNCEAKTAVADNNYVDSRSKQNLNSIKASGIIKLANFKVEGLKNPGLGNGDDDTNQNCYEDGSDVSQLADALDNGKSIQSMDFLEFPSVGLSEMK